MSDPEQPLGARLRTSRELRGLSIAKAADELHLDPWVIGALESGDYSPIGPSVYVKGHLRRYAGLLGLPEAEVLAVFDTTSAPSASQPRPASSVQLGSTLRMPREELSRRSVSAGAIVGVVIAALLLAGGLWWKPWHPRGRPAARLGVAAAPYTGRAASIEAPASATAIATEPFSAQDAASIVAPRAPLAALPAPQGAAFGATQNAALPAAQSAPPPTFNGVASLPGGTTVIGPPAIGDSGRVRLRLSFATDSWVDVHDATGRHAFAGNVRAHTVRVIAGLAPLKVHLGAAGGVQVELNNHAVAIGPQYIQHNAADFELNADGTVRAARRLLPRGARPRG